MNEGKSVNNQLQYAQAQDSTDGGRISSFMTLDSWNQDGNPTAIVDEFGPEMEQEAPPTLNGKPI